ncbi:DUF6503 family protein [Pontibacter pamirensis]|uniref:DUF6503 family protein n=1 Tax=Pontibacter pamirensis TaxID=2562824 RepID=UPI00138A37CB|nr:DUF6503 family protein [Pontibacter pamirensis]
MQTNRSNPFYSLTFKSLRSLLHLSGFLALLLLGSCQQEPTVDSELLEKTLAYHDPENNWPELKTRLYLSSADTAGQENRFEIELDNSTGYFAHISRQDGKEAVKGIADGKEFYLLDGKGDISAEDREKYGLTPDDLKWVHSFYGYLYGLPMKLTDEGVNVAEAANNEELEGKEYRVLEINYDDAVGSDNWFFYLNPESHAMEAYRFNHGEPESGEYILLEEEVMVDGIRMPKVRKWHWNKNNAYIGTDTIIKAEPLTSYRVSAEN